MVLSIMVPNFPAVGSRGVPLLPLTFLMYVQSLVYQVLCSKVGLLRQQNT
jgi:hypothetical protein